MDTIFTVKNEDLERLYPEEAVVFLREMLWAEARRIGVAISKIHITTRIDVPDGGIDALIEENITSSQSGLIKEGCAGFQIKTGASFKPWQDAEIKEVLFGEKTPGEDNLGKSIRDCLDKDGAYVLVCFGQDLNVPQHGQAVEALRRYFKECGYKNPSVEVWSQGNLIGFLKVFPSLALKANRRDHARFQTHTGWSQEAEMKREFKVGQAQVDLILNMQHELRENSQAIHIRVWGEPGIGKTRLILEATRSEDLQPLVIYCDSAGKFRDSDLMYEILRDDNQFCVIMVIDECDPDSRSYIWNKLKYCGPRIKVISIYNDYDETSGNINYINVPPLDEAQISDIIQTYNIPKDQADRWPEYCSGSPRAAHVVGQNLLNNPEDLLRSPDTVNVWDRSIVGGDDPDSQRVQQRQLVLQHIALFKRFGFGRRVIAEAQAIASMVEQADPQLTWPKFLGIIKDLRARKILQGENTLYITPRLLHIKLWVDWWNVYGSSFDLENFSKKLPQTLLEWFYEMFKYAAESKIASGIVKELLGDKGPLQNNDYLKTELEAKFFLALTEADPESALGFLKRTVGAWSKEKLLQFTNGRREVVWALEMIAMWRELFPDVAKLLLALGEAENETWSNNASGVFTQLFSFGYGPVAPTEAPPHERLPILIEALESASKERRKLALQACNQALESDFFSRMVGAEHQGLRREPKLWMPKTYGELFEAYRQVWQMLYERLNNLLEDEKAEAVDILLRRSRGLGMIPNLTDMVIDTVEGLAQKPYVNTKKVLAEIIQILHYEGKEMPQQTRQRWIQLRDTITGNDFSSQMRRYVGMDILEDKFDEEGNQVDQIQPRIEELAQQTVDSEDLIKTELEWLVTTNAENGHRYGYELGKRDQKFSLLQILLEAQRNASKKASVFFLGGYFRAVFEKDRQRWEKELEVLAGDEILNRWAPELTWRSGMSDSAAQLILSLAEKDVIGIDDFGMFGYGGVIRDLSEDILNKWIEFLLGNGERPAVSIALDLWYFYYLRKESQHTMPEGLTLKLLTHQALFQKPEAKRRTQMEEYHWTNIGKRFVKLYPERSLDLADKILEHFGEEGTIVEGFHPPPHEVLHEITSRFPRETWKKVTKYLGPPMDSRAFHIKEWLRGGEFFREKEGALSIIPLEAIWKWVDEDVEKRARYLAVFVPNTLFREQGKVCLARETLARYGHREDVRRNLMANFSTEGWSGPASSHYQEKKQRLLDFKKEEDDENVKRWIDEYASSLSDDIERAEIEEERR
jgi:hypothetical protein